MAKSLDLLLVNPLARKVYQEEQEASDYPALEPPYLAALTAEFVRKRGYNVEILDANTQGLTAVEVSEAVEEFSPSLVHIIVHGNQPSASTQLMDEVNLSTTHIKLRLPKTKILLTGTHPSALPKLTLEESDADYVARGEGFYTVLGLLNSDSLSQVPGLWWRENGEIASGLPDKLLDTQELSSELETAAWDLLPMDKYRAHDWHALDDLNARQPYASIYTSFGCPFSCNFCCINAPFTDDGKRASKIRFRDPTNVVSEIEMLVKEYGVRNLKIIDEMFVLNPKHYISIAQGLIDRHLGDLLNIWAYARVDTVKEGHLDTLKKAGFNWLALGIESASKHVRDGIEKGRFGEEQIFDTVREIKSHGINIVGNFIFGLPDDSESSMQNTLDMATALNTERPNFYCAMAYPGSQLHYLASQRKLPVPDNWSKDRPLLPEEPNGPGWIGYSQHSYNTFPLPTRNLYPEQVLAFRDKALATYFSNSKYIAFLKEKFHGNTSEKIGKFCRVNSATPKRRILGD